MKKVKIVMVGSAGFANTYVNELLHRIEPEKFELMGIVDPYVAKAPLYNEIIERKIPLYNTLEEFYAESEADLAFISTPIRFHKPQSIVAMENGSNVLVEKPLMTNINEVDELKEVIERTGKQLAVGFQWSFSHALLEVKQDILNGLFGKPLFFQNFTIFSRYDSYYARSNWAGKIFDPSGYLVLDCIATNATAHYLHNIFFMLGDSISTSAQPKNIKVSLYRVNPIETFDNCFITGETESGVKFQYLTSHTDVHDRQPIIRYEFENAVLTYDSNERGTKMIATFKDGTIKEYDSPHASNCGYNEKVQFMIENVEKNLPIPCQVDTVLPHMRTCDAIFDLVDVHSFPEEMVYRAEQPNNPEGKGWMVKGLYDDMMKCWEAKKLPDEIGLPWAKPSTEIDMTKYTKFSGEKVGYKG